MKMSETTLSELTGQPLTEPNLERIQTLTRKLECVKNLTFRAVKNEFKVGEKVQRTTYEVHAGCKLLWICTTMEQAELEVKELEEDFKEFKARRFKEYFIEMKKELGYA